MERLGARELLSSRCAPCASARRDARLGLTGSSPAPAATDASKSCGSIFATSSPFFTVELKSAKSFCDPPGDLRAHLHRDDRRERPARGDLADDVASARPRRSCTGCPARGAPRGSARSRSLRRGRRRGRTREGASSCESGAAEWDPGHRSSRCRAGTRGPRSFNRTTPGVVGQPRSSPRCALRSEKHLRMCRAALCPESEVSWCP